MISNNSEQKQTFNKIEHTSINLPKGGGAIRGVGEKFQSNPVTGSGSFSLPLPITPGRGGFDPELSLSYDSGSGNSSFGLGWDYGVPSITRKTAKELPQYIDSATIESDTFLLAGAEDLVPVLDSYDNRVSYEKIETTNDVTNEYHVYPYKPRIEGLFAKIEKWVDSKTNHIHWRVTTKENITSIYGKNIDSCIVDPSDDKKVFEWLIERSFDAKSNIIHYEYKQEDSSNLSKSINEIQRVKYNRGFANKHLKGVKYSSFHNDADRFHFHLVFDYGEHTTDTPEEVTSWSCRLDPFSTFKSGFEVRNYRLCKRVLMFHNFPAESSAPDSWELVKSINMTYEESKTLTYLTSAQINGHKLIKVSETGELEYETKSMPAIEYTYSKPELGKEIKQLDEKSLQNLPAGLDEQTYQWIDLKGEGSPGILSRQGSGIYYKENLGMVS